MYDRYFRIIRDDSGGVAGFVEINDAKELRPPADSAVCCCGHRKDNHFRGRNTCLHSTPTDTWACECAEFTSEVIPEVRRAGEMKVDG